MEALVRAVEKKLDGIKLAFGGEELKRAAASLAPLTAAPRVQPWAQSTSSSASTNSAPGPAAAAAASGTSAAGVNDDLDEQLKELAITARQYAAAAAESPEEFDPVYNHALLLQEFAGQVTPGSAQHVKLLRQACDKYAAALQLKPSHHAALYNWGVALNDLARVLKKEEPLQARHCLHLASLKYCKALEFNPANPQALNNWGLVLQELSMEERDLTERDALVKHALEKFRLAIRIRPDFDRGCYNLGTVFFTYAGLLQNDSAQLSRGLPAYPGGVAHDATSFQAKHAREAEIKMLFSTAAQYICLAFAWQPGKEVYRKSYNVVKQVLPLPFLRAGYLYSPTAGTLGTARERYQRMWFVLDHMSLRSANNMELSLSSASAGISTTGRGAGEEEPSLVLPLLSILSVQHCHDFSITPGYQFWVQLDGMMQGIYFVAEDQHAAHAWVDALLIASHLVSVRSPVALAEALVPSHKRAHAQAPGMIAGGNALDKRPQAALTNHVAGAVAAAVGGP